MLTRESRIARIVLVGLIALMLTVSTSLQAIADDRTEGGGLSDGDGGDVATNTFVVPPTGYVVTYFFPGARTNSDGTVATTVLCSNISATVTPLRVEFYDFLGVLRGVGNFSMAGYRTATITGGSATVFYFEDVSVALSGILNQGVVRVLKKGTGRIICTATVLDAANFPPSFAITLPHFGPTGLH